MSHQGRNSIQAPGGCQQGYSVSYISLLSFLAHQKTLVCQERENIKWTAKEPKKGKVSWARFWEKWPSTCCLYSRWKICQKIGLVPPNRENQRQDKDLYPALFCTHAVLNRPLREWQHVEWMKFVKVWKINLFTHLGVGRREAGGWKSPSFSRTLLNLTVLLSLQFLYGLP